MQPACSLPVWITQDAVQRALEAANYIKQQPQRAAIMTELGEEVAGGKGGAIKQGL